MIPPEKISQRKFFFSPPKKQILFYKIFICINYKVTLCCVNFLIARSIIFAKIISINRRIRELE